ncbi:hypothetical protein [Enterobacter mori]|uniref:hypothetical protein n=1 Tax=Enterobacter mori TaxID=539813 RepID=UPI002ED00F7F|nr:hypothetical protein [Enterobacter mori]
MTPEDDEPEEPLTPEEMELIHDKIMIYLRCQSIVLPDDAELLIEFSGGEIKNIIFTEGEPLRYH